MIKRERNAFTILETLLAASLGAMLVLVALGIMAAMDRTQGAVQRRQDQVDSLTRLHLIMERTFYNLVMQNSTGLPMGGGSSQTEEPNLEKDAARNGEKQAEPRARMMLEVDAGSKSDSTLGAVGRGTRPQRLEVVLNKAPVPPGWGRDSTAEVMLAAQATEELRQGMASMRGVFELRPDRFTPEGGASATLAPDQGGMTLWWRPLPAQPTGAEGDPYAMDPTQDPAAVPIVSGLVECRWLAFKTIMEDGKPKSREKMPEISSMQFQDLPAYMEMVVRTASGVTVNWMFEVGWTNGPETTEEAEQEAVDQSEAGQEGGGGRGGEGRGGQGGGQGPGGAGAQRTRAVPMGGDDIKPGPGPKPRGGRGGGP